MGVVCVCVRLNVGVKGQTVRVNVLSEVSRLKMQRNIFLSNKIRTESKHVFTVYTINMLYCMFYIYLKNISATIKANAKAHICRYYLPSDIWVEF